DQDKIDKTLFRVKGVVEKPDLKSAPSNLGITGIYIFGKFIYDYLQRIGTGRNGEYQLSDAYNLMIKDMEVFALEMKGKRYDIGNKELWIKTFVEFAIEQHYV
ncbi:MAG: sugar phosphate nucleotidyltransferase, partial [Thermoplasmatales archaeon]